MFDAIMSLDKFHRTSWVIQFSMISLSLLLLAWHYITQVLSRARDILHTISSIIGIYLCLPSEMEVVRRRITFWKQASSRLIMRACFRDVRKWTVRHTSLSLTFPAQSYQEGRHTYMYQHTDQYGCNTESASKNAS